VPDRGDRDRRCHAYQRDTSQQVLQAGGDYVWLAKGNQARTLWSIQKLFVHEACNLKNGAPLSKDIHTAETVNKGHGRREKRTLWASTELNDYLDWPGSPGLSDRKSDLA